MRDGELDSDFHNTVVSHWRENAACHGVDVGQNRIQQVTLTSRRANSLNEPEFEACVVQRGALGGVAA